MKKTLNVHKKSEKQVLIGKSYFLRLQGSETKKISKKIAEIKILVRILILFLYLLSTLFTFQLNIVSNSEFIYSTLLYSALLYTVLI